MTPFRSHMIMAYTVLIVAILGTGQLKGGVITYCIVSFQENRCNASRIKHGLSAYFPQKAHVNFTTHHEAWARPTFSASLRLVPEHTAVTDAFVCDCM